MTSSGSWRDNAYAVIIGINKYQDRNISDLDLARADAEAMSVVLTDKNIGAIHPDNVILLLDEEATQRNIVSAIGTKIPKLAGEDDTVIIYYAGHGSPLINPKSGNLDGMEKYLVPADGVQNDLRSTGISMDDVQKYFSYIESKQVLFFIDSCYSGEAGGRTFSSHQFTRRNLMTDDFLDKIVGEGRLVITACDINEVSLELPTLGHGLFTYYLIQGLKGLADKDKDGLVTVDELYEFIYKKVSEHARQIAGSMHPIKKGQIKGNIYLTGAKEQDGDVGPTNEEYLKDNGQRAAKENNENGVKKFWDWSRKIVKEKPGILFSAFSFLIAITAFLIEYGPQIFSPQPSKYLSLAREQQLPDSIFVALYNSYNRDSLFTLALKADPSKNVQADLQFALTGLASKSLSIINDFDGIKKITLDPPALAELIKLKTNQTVTAKIKLLYKQFDQKSIEDTQEYSKNMKIIQKNYIDFTNSDLLSAFLTPNEPEIEKTRKWVNSTLQLLNEKDVKSSLGANIIKSIVLYYWMKNYELELRRFSRKKNHLKFPIETLSQKVGTANDFTVLFSSLLSANGVENSLYAAKDNQLILLVNSKIPLEKDFLLLSKQYSSHRVIDPGNKIWLPLNLAHFDGSYYDCWVESRIFSLPENVVEKAIFSDFSGLEIHHDEILNNLFDVTDTLNPHVVNEITTWHEELIKPVLKESDEIWLPKLAMIYLEAGDTDCAKNHLRQALQRNPNISETHFLMGNAYYREQDYTQAIPFFESAVNLDSHFTEAFFMLACSYKKTGKTRRARDVFYTGKSLDQLMASKFIRCNPDVEID